MTMKLRHFSMLLLLLLLCLSAIAAAKEKDQSQQRSYTDIDIDDDEEEEEKEESFEGEEFDPGKQGGREMSEKEMDLLEFASNLEYLEAEFFLSGALGQSLNEVAPDVVGGGPRPRGARMASLDSMTRDIIEEFAIEEVGHLRAIRSTLRQQRRAEIRRPIIDLSASTFGKIMCAAMNDTALLSFDPYASSINFLLSSYLIPYVGLTGYVGTLPRLRSRRAARLVGGLLGVESGQDAVIRTLLYERRDDRLQALAGVTVADVTDAISSLRNSLGGTGEVDQGLTQKPIIRRRGKGMPGRILAGDRYSVSFSRTPQQILRIAYSSGAEDIPGGFFPSGANGRIAQECLRHRRCGHQQHGHAGPFSVA